jgi:hypothetical protein
MTSHLNRHLLRHLLWDLLRNLLRDLLRDLLGNLLRRNLEFRGWLSETLKAWSGLLRRRRSDTCEVLLWSLVVGLSRLKRGLFCSEKALFGIRGQLNRGLIHRLGWWGSSCVHRVVLRRLKLGLVLFRTFSRGIQVCLVGVPLLLEIRSFLVEQLVSFSLQLVLLHRFFLLPFGCFSVFNSFLFVDLLLQIGL